MRITLVFATLIIFFLTSCRSNKLQKKGVDIGKANVDSTVTGGKLVINELDFSQIRFKSDVDLSSKAISQKFPITIHIQKDAVIWASVSIGLEIGRAKITQDSLVFMDRFNRRAYMGTWNELSAASGFELSYNILQSMLIGDMPFPIESNDQINMGASVSSVLQERNGMVFDNKIDNTVQKLFEVKGKDPGSGSALDLSFKSFITENSRMLPSVISMILSGKTDAKLEVKHSRIEFVESGLSFSFSVPANYKIERLPGI